jgi:hypothetical protein
MSLCSNFYDMGYPLFRETLAVILLRESNANSNVAQRLAETLDLLARHCQ